MIDDKMIDTKCQKKFDNSWEPAVSVSLFVSVSVIVTLSVSDRHSWIPYIK